MFAPGAILRLININMDKLACKLFIVFFYRPEAMIKGKTLQKESKQWHLSLASVWYDKIALSLWRSVLIKYQILCISDFQAETNCVVISGTYQYKQIKKKGKMQMTILWLRALLRSHGRSNFVPRDWCFKYYLLQFKTFRKKAWQKSMTKWSWALRAKDLLIDRIQEVNWPLEISCWSCAVSLHCYHHTVDPQRHHSDCVQATLQQEYMKQKWQEVKQVVTV